MKIYDFDVQTIKGEKQSLRQYKNKIVLIVNTASKCGFTPQYKELQVLYEKYCNQGFIVLGFPCNQFLGQEPGGNSEIESFCKMNYGVSFPMFSKIDVNGENAHPLFDYLADKVPGLMGSKTIKWNFTKFLINSNGEVVKRYSPNTSPIQIEPDIKKLLTEVVL